MIYFDINKYIALKYEKKSYILECMFLASDVLLLKFSLDSWDLQLIYFTENKPLANHNKP